MWRLISRFATDILVVDCILHSQVMKHLVDQLRGCKNLRKLVLSPLEFPDNFDDIISSLSSLETVVLSGTLEHANGCLLAGLSHPHMLNVLSINGCTLSGQVLHLFGDQDHPGFVQLKALLMVDAKLDKVDLKGICTAVSNDKLPLLWVLDLSGNVLTDCLADLLGGSGEPRFLCLAHLCLSNTKLSKRDMDSFASAVNYCKLPAIESVDLSDNVLTDIMSTLVGQTDYPGFRSLTHLKVTNCKLSTSDVKCAMAALRLGKLPNLGTLEDFPQVSHEWLSDFLITNHPACPEVVSLDLEKKGLSGADMKAISDAAKQGKFNQLKEINLSENTLTNCLSDLFGSSDRPGFPSLEILELENTKLSQNDLIRVFEALRDGKLPKLHNIKVLPLNLRDYLDDFLIAAHHPIFPYRNSMTLENCNLSANTIRSICTSIRDGKLSNLQEMNLSDNKLTNCMSDLFGLSDKPGFPRLRRLCLNNCELSEVDVVSIFSAGTTLAKLKELDLSNNCLTDLIESLLSGIDHPGFLNLQTLSLKSSQLSITDLEILANSIHTGELPTLCELDLSNNILTNWLRYLLGIESETDLLSLSRLMLDNTHLNKDDVQSISIALTFFKLPKLKLLSLKGNSLCSAEKEVEMLIQSFNEFAINLDGQGMSLDLRVNNFSQRVH